jgi:hypothetical protein
MASVPYSIKKRNLQRKTIRDFCKRHVLPVLALHSNAAWTELLDLRDYIARDFFFLILRDCCEKKNSWTDLKLMKIRQHTKGIVTPFPSECTGQFHHRLLHKTLLAFLFLLQVNLPLKEK